MIRLLVYLILLFLLAAGFVWLAERPGNLVLAWQDYEVHTSLMAAAIAIAALVAVLTILGAALRAIFRAPKALGAAMVTRRRDRGYRALSRGMVAIGAGDSRAARRASQESRSLLGEQPLVMLLAAQTAQMGGNHEAARKAFESLTEQPDTRILGLHGLFIEARRRGEHAAALHFAEEAQRHSAQIPWAGQAMFEYRSRAGDWDGALAALAANLSAGLVDKARAARLRAVLLTARALELEAGSPDEARAAAVEAAKLAPDLVPAAAVAARLLTRHGDIRRASKLLEAAWKLSPHPDLAAAYAQVRSGDSMQDRLKRVTKLAAMKANNPEGSIAVAQAAIAALEWQTARDILSGLMASDPSERVCLLMADVEEGENGDLGKVRAWLARALYAPRDPVWTADSKIYENWVPVSPVSGEVDTVVWRVVPAQTPPPRALDLDDVETGGPTAIVALAPVPVSDIVDDADSVEVASGDVEKPELVEVKSDVAEVSDKPPAEPETDEKPVAVPGTVPAAKVSEAEPVAPPAPDDPGPESRDDDEDRARFRNDLNRPA
jgi:HemY protein